MTNAETNAANFPTQEEVDAAKAAHFDRKAAVRAASELEKSLNYASRMEAEEALDLSKPAALTTLEEVDAAYMSGAISFAEKADAEALIRRGASVPETVSESILVRASLLQEVLDLGVKAGVVVKVSEVSPETVWYIVWNRETSPAREDWDRMKAHAPKYVWINLQAPAAGGALLCLLRLRALTSTAAIAVESATIGSGSSLSGRLPGLSNLADSAPKPPQSASVPETVSKSILVRASRLQEVLDLGVKAGVVVKVSEVSPETVWYIVWNRETSPAREDWDRMKAHAPKYVWINLQAPAAGDVVAVADRQDGAPTFMTTDTDAWEWTVAKMDALDFHRCDRCGVRHDRKRVLFVRTATGVEQLGGQCAKAASERLRAAIAWMSVISKLSAGWGEDYLGGMGRYQTHADPDLLLSLAAIMINRHGYEKGGPTRDAVKDLYLDYISPRSRVNIGKELAALSPTLVEDVMAWAAGMKDGDFARNMAVALQTGSLRLLGVLCYAPEGLRRAQEKALRETTKTASWPYDPTTDTLAAKLATWSSIDLKMSPKVYEKAAGGKMSAGNTKKIERCLSGLWTIMSLRVFEGFEYTTTYVTFQRTDGASVTWASSGDPGTLKTGAVYRLRASVGELRKNAKYGDERRVRRVDMTPAN